MKSQWWMYLIVAIIAAVAGLAIAGPPRSSSVDATIIAPVSTVAPTSTVASTVAPNPTTTVPVPIETDPPAADPPATDPPKKKKPRRTDPPVEDTLPPLAEPATIAVVVANGAEISGAAGRTAADLEALGYTNTDVTDGDLIVDATIVYFADPYFFEAVRMTSELGLPPEAVASIAEAPATRGGLEGAGLLVYLGRDQA